MSAKTQAFIDALKDKVARQAFDNVDTLLAAEVELNTPRFLKPIRDRRHFAIVLQTVPRVVEGFHYTRTWATEHEAIMEFKGKIGDIVVEGLDIFALDDEGKCRELTVFLRPTKAHAALAAAEDHIILERLAATGAPSAAP